MKIVSLSITLLTAVTLAGCSGNPQATEVSTQPTAQATTAQATAAQAGSATVAHAYPEGSIKAGDSALCVVCAVDDGATEKEPAHEVLTYHGKTYAFCNEKEKAEFISNTAKYAPGE